VNCEQAQELIALAASGDLTAAEQTSVDRHMARCGACRSEAAAFAVLQGELAALRQESLPESAFAAVRARVVEDIASRHRFAWLKAWPAFAAAMACSAILIVLFRPATLPQPPQVEREADAVPVPVRPAQPPVAAPFEPVRRAKRRAIRIHKSSEPLVIQMLTNDPNVIIYWIADARDGRAGKESNP
jgi:anti-sigma factor RsiW